MQKPRRFRGFHSLIESRTSNQLPDQDSNLDKQNQNLLCYRYTIGYRKRGGSLVEHAGATQEPWLSLKNDLSRCREGGNSPHAARMRVIR